MGSKLNEAHPARGEHHRRGNTSLILIVAQHFGQSPLPVSYNFTTQQVASDIVRLLDGIGIERFHLVGAKIGGSTALQLAAD